MTTRSSALLLPRLVGVLGLRAATFREVAADGTAGMQAGLVVVLSGVLEAAVYAATHGETSPDSSHTLYAVVAALLGWMVWSGLLFAAGARLFDQPAPFDAVVRTVGFAHSSTLLYGVASVALTEWAGLLLLASIFWFVAMLVAAAGAVFRVPPSRAVLITLAAMAGHEVLRQGLRIAGLTG